MNITPPIHVGIISNHRIELPVSQERELYKRLNAFCSYPAGRIILHHGCSTEADITDLIWASDIIVAVQPLPSSISTLLREATDAGWQVIYIEEPELKRYTIPAPREANHDWLGDAWR
jgi:hypothetical protein